MAHDLGKLSADGLLMRSVRTRGGDESMVSVPVRASSTTTHCDDLQWERHRYRHIYGDDGAENAMVSEVKRFSQRFASLIHADKSETAVDLQRHIDQLSAYKLQTVTVSKNAELARMLGSQVSTDGCLVDLARLEGELISGHTFDDSHYNKRIDPGKAWDKLRQLCEGGGKGVQDGGWRKGTGAPSETDVQRLAYLWYFTMECRGKRSFQRPQAGPLATVQYDPAQLACLTVSLDRAKLKNARVKGKPHPPYQKLLPAETFYGYGSARRRFSTEPAGDELDPAVSATGEEEIEPQHEFSQYKPTLYWLLKVAPLPHLVCSPPKAHGQPAMHNYDNHGKDIATPGWPVRRGALS
jgi:hypothetical protein